jgi:glucose 1-dehydrogenase
MANRTASGVGATTQPSAVGFRPLSGKVALVTGASSGIGKAIAQELGRLGAKVVVNYIGGEDRADAVVGDIKAAGSDAIVARADVSKSAEVQAMVKLAIDAFGQIDLLVNNAGIEQNHPFLDKPEEVWDQVIAVDLKGPFLCSQAAAREMAKRGKGGTIVNVSSVHEDIAFPGHVAYCAAKGGLRMLCRDMAIELAPHGINVVNVAPGAIDTPINTTTLKDPRLKQELIDEIPLRRIGTPEEVARLVAYLAGDDAKYITGTTVVIDGGLMRATGGL